jgi:hypothetical protein
MRPNNLLGYTAEDKVVTPIYSIDDNYLKLLVTSNESTNHQFTNVSDCYYFCQQNSCLRKHGLMFWSNEGKTEDGLSTESEIHFAHSIH